MKSRSITTPTFLGIGAPRCGTTWLHVLLDSHPQVYVPKQRKEIGYFSRYYHKGLDWYCSYFPSPDEANNWKAIGEVTPDYLYSPQSPARIRELETITRLIVILRDPVTRLESSYHNMVANHGFKGSINEYLERYPEHLDQSLYSDYLDRYLTEFERDQILILVFERAVADVDSTKQQLAEFLSIDPGLFPPAAGQARVNTAFRTAAPALYSRLAAFNRAMRNNKLTEPLIDIALRISKCLNTRKLFRPSRPSPVLHEMHLPDQYIYKLRQDRAVLRDKYGLEAEHWLDPENLE